MLALIFGAGALLAEAKCYDGGGNFKASVWPRCHEASVQLDVYSGLSDDGQFVKLGLHAYGHSRGWSAIGFSGNGGMKGASQIVVRLNDDGDWVAEDRYSLDYVTPTLDPQQHVKLMFAQDNGLNISWGVLIPKDSCDPNDYATENVSRAFLWALGGAHTFAQHVNRGQFHANLINGLVPFQPLTDITEVPLKMPNATLVSQSSDATNPYICGIFDLRELFVDRDLNQIIHVAKFSPNLDPVSSKYVHHMILYGCDSNDGFEHNTMIEDCQSMPSGCYAFKWVWAVGGQDVQLPDDVGMPLGEGKFFVALQVHYYNPLHENVNDTSGVTLSVTTTNRAINAGILQLNGGASFHQRGPLPPNTSRFTVPTLVVPNECTADWEEPINVVAAIHHMHLLGVHQQIEVARNGTNLGMLRNERIYDFKHQSLEEPLVHQLFPGDEIKVSCDYDTTGKSVPTEFGENTDNEMCWAALMFYPAQDFSNAMYWNPRDATADTNPCLESIEDAPLSGCATAYLASPFEFYLATEFPLDAVELCNEMTAENRTYTNELQTKFWGDTPMCPPCGMTSNCTIQQLLDHGHSLCPEYCAQFGVSAFPNVTNPPLIYTHRTSCDGQSGQAMHNFNATFPPLSACTIKGNLELPAVKDIIATVFPDQYTCPNGAIKAFVASCSSVDFSLNGTCREACRTAVTALNVSFHSVLSPAQNIQCLRDYNSTWGIDVVLLFADTALWDRLEPLILAGEPICSAVVDTPTAAPTPMTFPKPPAFTSSALFPAPSIIVMVGSLITFWFV